MAWCRPDKAAGTQEGRQRESEEIRNEIVGRALLLLGPMSGLNPQPLRTLACRLTVG